MGLKPISQDAAAGWHVHNHSEDFHVPPLAAEAAAREAMRMVLSQDAKPLEVPQARSPLSRLPASGSNGSCRSDELARRVAERRVSSCEATVPTRLLRKAGMNRHCESLSRQGQGILRGV